jgi:uncharacterized membrane protein
MESRVRDGLVMTAVGFGAIGLMFLIEVPLPFNGATYTTTRAFAEMPIVVGWASAILFGLVGVFSLLDIYPGWGFEWG